MRLGFDFDNVLANFIDPLNDYLNAKFGLEFDRDVWKERTVRGLDINLDKETEDALVKEVHQVIHNPEFLVTLPPRNGAKSVINFLKKKGYEIYIITARKKCNFDVSSVWLKDHGIQFDALLCDEHKPRVAWAYGVKAFVDDDYDILLDFVNFRRAKFFHKLIVMDYPYNQDRHHKRIERAKTLHDVLAILDIKGRDLCDHS